MLVIRRRAGESLLIGDDIEVEILGLTQGQVKLGIRAPKTIPILRKEVRLAGDQNREAAGLGSLESLENLLRILRDGERIGSRSSPDTR
jgi:carbon storage regulator